MNRFLSLFPRPRSNVLGMIHVAALPGTPANNGRSVAEIVDLACQEAEIYKSFDRIDSVIVENMHDIPYVKHPNIGPEVVAAMTTVAKEVRRIFPEDKPVGIQVYKF